MKKEHLLGILFFGGLWGLSESVVGGWIYAAQLRMVGSIVLAVVAFFILTVARTFVPLPGSSAAIGALAMLFKFFNQPFFACHLLAIFLLGASFDLVFSLARGRAKPLIAVASAYLGLGSFAFVITYVVRYSYWIDAGWPKVAGYIGVNGSIVAACSALVVPLAHVLGQWLTTRRPAHAPPRRDALAAVGAVTAALWVFAIAQVPMHVF